MIHCCITVRLACIRHAASVHPEPGSNSPYIVSTNVDYSRTVARLLGFFVLTRQSKLPCSCLSARLLSFTIPLLRCVIHSLRQQKTASSLATGFGRHLQLVLTNP